MTANATFITFAHTAFRIGVGLLFLQHGLQKLFGLLGGKPVPISSLMGVAGILEFAGGILLIAGLFVRPVAALLTIEMLVAFAKAHLPRGGMPIQNGGELPLLFAMAFLMLAAYGAGAFSLAALIFRRGPSRLAAVARRSMAA